MRDNLFVLNAVLSSERKPNKESFDIYVYDVEKCFDSMWSQECINDLYMIGFSNDKLPLLFIENSYAQIVVKVPCGMTKRGTV